MKMKNYIIIAIIITLVVGGYITYQTLQSKETTLINNDKLIKDDCITLAKKGNGIEGDTCCDGLSSIAVCFEEENYCACMENGAFICSECGNGNCEAWENKCNCKEDCK